MITMNKHKIEQCMDCPIIDWNPKDCFQCFKFDFGIIEPITPFIEFKTSLWKTHLKEQQLKKEQKRRSLCL